MRGVRVAECLRAVTARTSLSGGNFEWSEHANLRDRPLPDPFPQMRFPKTTKWPNVAVRARRGFVHCDLASLRLCVFMEPASTQRRRDIQLLRAARTQFG